MPHKRIRRIDSDALVGSLYMGGSLSITAEDWNGDGEIDLRQPDSPSAESPGRDLPASRSSSSEPPSETDQGTAH